MLKLQEQKQVVDCRMQERGAKYAVIRQGQRIISENPYDPIPRVLSAEDFNLIERGLIQRVSAINVFLNDIYRRAIILQDGVIPEAFVYSSPDFYPQCLGVIPAKSIYTHIMATDLVRAQDGKWYVIEDRLSAPEGITYTHFSRQLCRDTAPEEFDLPKLCDNCGLDILLKQLYHDIIEDNPVLEDGLIVLLQEDVDSLASFELQYIADLTGAVVAPAEKLIVMDNRVYYRAPEGGFQKVSILHRFLPDCDLDPLCFDDSSRYGIPHLMEVYSAGNIAIINAPGCSVAEDRGLSALVPDMIRYYLDEEPILPPVPTYLPWYEDQRDYILSHLDTLIIKEADGKRRTGAIYPKQLDVQQRSALIADITENPRNYIAQEPLRVESAPVLAADGTTVSARCDLRMYTVHSDSIRVWMGGLTRFTANEENGTRFSGFKDTLVMSE